MTGHGAKVIYPAGDIEMGAFRMFKGLLSTETLKRAGSSEDPSMP